MEKTVMKRCSWCQKDKPESEFYKNPRQTKQGITSHCKECCKKISKHYRNPEFPMPSKVIPILRRCGRCKLEKPLTEFYPRKRKDAPNGLASYCKSCVTTIQKILRKEGKLKYKQIYNSDRAKQYSAKHRAKKLSNGGSYTAKEWRELKKFYNYTCLCCGKKEPQITLVPDHVIPIAKGGSSDIENIQPLCYDCNNHKHTDIQDYRPNHILSY